MRHEANGRALQSRLHRVHHPLRSAMQLQFALSSRRNSSHVTPLRFPTRVTRPVTSYQDIRNAEEVSRPYISIFLAFALTDRHIILSLPVPNALKAGFPFISGMWESRFWCPNSLFQFVTT